VGAGLKPAPTLILDSLATLIYTSGTTGEPKGVMLTHGNFLSNCQACAQVIPINDRDVYLSFLPLAHVFERLAGYYLMIHQGAVIAYAENIDTVPQNMMEVQPTVMCGVPRFFEKLYGRVMESVQQSTGLKRKIAEWAFELARRGGVTRPEQSRRAPPLQKWQPQDIPSCLSDRSVGAGLKPAPTLSRTIADLLVFRKLRSKLGGRLRFFVSGSAPLAKEIAEFFHGVGILIIEGYGLTETSPVISCNRLDRFRFGTVGLPVPGVEVKIAPDGEILTRGPHVMKGYYKMETPTKEVLADDGWFHTGDIGEIDSDGFLKITDRKKDLIITSGGKNVAPQKIENLLKQDEYILDAMLYGDRKKYLTALLIPNLSKLESYAKEQSISWTSTVELLQNSAIQQLIRQRIDLKSTELAPYEQIKYFVLLDKPLSQEAGELTPTLKIRRKIVTEKYRDLLEKLYTDNPY
ncbi:MAG: long-chain fatty acid--CoA ligase, partial [Candidatus Omnitrophica bacterium]|nr:long-chain fatty acid--CoA ligase [Candidatus Omnitrophota bacterium]